MKVQWSLRTLLIVMTLGGPLLAGSIHLGANAARSLSRQEQVCPGGHATKVTWDKAIREAQKVQTLSIGFRVVDKRCLELDQAGKVESTMQRPPRTD